MSLLLTLSELYDTWRDARQIKATLLMGTDAVTAEKNDNGRSKYFQEHIDRY